MARDPKSNYYDAGGIEVLDVIKAKLTPEQYEGYLLGNIIKYSLRANHKGSKVRDIEKIGEYQRELKDHVKPVLPALPGEINLAGRHAQPTLIWDGKPFDAHKFSTSAARDQEAFFKNVHPDYKAYGGL